MLRSALVGGEMCAFMTEGRGEGGVGVWTECCLSDIGEDVARMGVSVWSLYKFNPLRVETNCCWEKGAEPESQR